MYHKQLALQPLTVVVRSVFNIEQTYVVINDTWYETKYLLEAISFTFESFFAVDCAYPEKSENIWLFIQRAVYDIKIPGEKVGIKVKTIEKQLEQILGESSK